MDLWSYHGVSICPCLTLYWAKKRIISFSHHGVLWYCSGWPWASRCKAFFYLSFHVVHFGLWFHPNLPDLVGFGLLWGSANQSVGRETRSPSGVQETKEDKRESASLKLVSSWRFPHFSIGWGQTSGASGQSGSKLWAFLSQLREAHLHCMEQIASQLTTFL